MYNWRSSDVSFYADYLSNQLFNVLKNTINHYETKYERQETRSMMDKFRTIAKVEKVSSEKWNEVFKMLERILQRCEDLISHGYSWAYLLYLLV